MELRLNYGIEFIDLYEDLNKVNSTWREFLHSRDEDLFHALTSATHNPNISKKEESALIIALSWHLEAFLGSLFKIETDIQNLSSKHTELAPLYQCKRLFIQRDAARKSDQLASINTNSLLDFTTELDFATAVCERMKQNEDLEEHRQYAIWALFSPEGKQKHKSGILFKLPTKTDFQNLLPNLEKQDGCYSSKHLVHRDGFNLTDSGYSLAQSLDQANYCIHCHNQGKDSCSNGMKDLKENKFKVNDLGVTLAGCPLEEKISEMNLLKAEGSIIGAFAAIMIDNPMVAGTGHRICNDCMKACIYQKQEPVNIPMVETQTLNDVLDLPWGFEIYSLLSRWNPLNFNAPYPSHKTDKKVLIAGLGPAGYTLSHHLLNTGHTIVAIDGLKIEPLPEELSGIDQLGNRVPFHPIYNVHDELYERLSERKGYGFGGVAEYGITVRWDKNYLKIIRLLLERRANFRMYGGIRFGGNISTSDAWKLGFDHIALCMGAGKPNLLNLPNTMAKGVRTASDFLMALQLTGAGRSSSIANLTVRLPVVVIGGGLTAIDSATESLAYYPIQVEKFLQRLEKVGSSFLDELSEEDRKIAEIFAAHAKELRVTDDKIACIKKWGGVNVVYRKTLQDSPAYRLNHEEIEKALEEGIGFIENITPEEIKLDEYGNVSDIIHNNGTIPAQTIIIAAGTNPNTILATEDPDFFALDGKYFTLKNIANENVSPERVSKPSKVNVITHIDSKRRAISFFGDQHPSFAGNVVKAMGSAKQGAPIINQILLAKAPESSCTTNEFFQALDSQLIAQVKEVIRLTHNIVEVILYAPSAARNFNPGQFYRLQNYEIGDNIAIEGLALTGAWVDKENGLLSTIVLEMGGSSNLCAKLKPNENVVLMGPTGEPTEINGNETVVLVGGGLGNAVLFSIGKAFREAGSKVIYFAGYKKAADRYKIADIEAAADIIIWCCDEVELEKTRPQDLSFHGNIIAGIAHYGSLQQNLKLEETDRIIAIGSDKMMAAVAYARHNHLKAFFPKNPIAIASINSPMQCMMKEICGQCIQKHIDPITKEESYVFSCTNQDQDMDMVDFPHLARRLEQNSLQEKLCAKYLL